MWNPNRRLRQALSHHLPRPVDVGPPVELDVDHAQPDARGAPHGLHAGGAVDGYVVEERRRDRLLGGLFGPVLPLAEAGSHEGGPPGRHDGADVGEVVYVGLDGEDERQTIPALVSEAEAILGGLLATPDVPLVAAWALGTWAAARDRWLLCGLAAGPAAAAAVVRQQGARFEPRFLAVAVTIQQTSGGNLAEILDGLAKVVRSRFRLFRRVKAITAEAQWSGKFLSGFPIACLIFILVKDPGYYDEVLDHPWFIPACFVVGILLTLNLIVMKIITNIKV